MRKAIMLGLAGVFLSSAAWAEGGCFGQTAATEQQTVMTDQHDSNSEATKEAVKEAVKTEPKG